MLIFNNETANVNQGVNLIYHTRQFLATLEETPGCNADNTAFRMNCATLEVMCAT